MKNKSLIIKTMLTLVLAISALSTSIVHIFAVVSDTKDINTESFTIDMYNEATEKSEDDTAIGDKPSDTTDDSVTEDLNPDVGNDASDDEKNPDSGGDIVIDDGKTPVSQEQLVEKFGVYTVVSEENGKSVVTVYSSAQISDIVARRENGEWMSLSNEEALYLMNDTLILFNKYDIVRINNINGETLSYYGSSFYSSEEYYSSFCGILTEEQTNASYDLKRDVYEAMFARLEVLNSGVVRSRVSSHGQEGVIHVGLENPYKYWEGIDGHIILSHYMDIDGFSEDRFQNEDYNHGTLLFYSEKIYYVSNLADSNQDDLVRLYPDGLFSAEVGKDKYDVNESKVIVIEVWDEATKSCVARIRLDSVNDAEQVAEIEDLWNGVENNISGAPISEYDTVTDYRVAVYMNGIGFDGINGDVAFRYHPDGNLNLWAFLVQDDIFQHDFLYGIEPLSQYINQILVEKLS